MKFLVVVPSPSIYHVPSAPSNSHVWGGGVHIGMLSPIYKDRYDYDYDYNKDDCDYNYDQDGTTKFIYPPVISPVRIPPPLSSFIVVIFVLFERRG